MLIKVTTDIFIEVDDEEAAEYAASTIQTGLLSQMAGFPAGDVVGVDVQSAKPATDDEATPYRED